MDQDIKPGDRVRTPNGDVGRVRSVVGRRATVDEDSGYGWLGLVDDLVKFGLSSDEMESVTMAQPGSLKVGDTVRENRQGAETGKVVDVRENMVTVRYRRQGGGAHDEDFHVTKLVKMSTMERSIQDLVDEYKRLNRALANASDQDADAIRRKRDQVQAEIEKRGGPKGFDLTEVEVSPDGSVEVCVDPEGDEAAAGLMTYARQASCPYCRKTVAMSAGQLGDHRAAAGVCPGSRRGVARVEMGRAVLMADKEYYPVPVGWVVQIEASDGVVRWHRVTSSTSTHVTARPLKGDDVKYGAREVTRPISEVLNVRRSLQ